MLEHMGSAHPEIGQAIADSGNLPEDLAAQLTEAINNFKATFQLSPNPRTGTNNPQSLTSHSGHWCPFVD